MTLEDFLRLDIDGHPVSQYVQKKGFKPIYVRRDVAYVDGAVFHSTLTIANITCKKPGNGAFTRMVRVLHGQGWNIFVEEVCNPRFARKLDELGFRRVNVDRWDDTGATNWFLEA